jgi:hypothetical protein
MTKFSKSPMLGFAFKEHVFGGGSGIIIAFFASEIFRIDILSLIVPLFFLGSALWIVVTGEALQYIHFDIFSRYRIVNFKKHPIVYAYGKEANKIAIIYFIIGLICFILGKSFFLGLMTF